MAIKGAHGQPGDMVPHLVVRDVEAAVDFYVRAFGGKELYRSPLPGGMGEHVHMRIGRALVMVTTEMPGPAEGGKEGPPVRLLSPQSLGGVASLLELVVDDVDGTFRRAVSEGGTPSLPPTDMFWGDRYAWVRDPFGHLWALAQTLEVIDPEDMAARLPGGRADCC
jgi:PhnB protein